jgi:hypothetical protein
MRSQEEGESASDPEVAAQQMHYAGSSSAMMMGEDSNSMDVERMLQQ